MYNNREGDDAVLQYNDTCAALIKQINESLEKQANKLLREDDLTIMQVAVLVELDGAERQTLALKHLEHSFSVAQPTMLGIVRRLEQKALVEILCSPEDRRIRLVHLTPEGKEKCTFGYAHMQDAEENLLQALDAQERQVFFGMLQKIKASLA